jgi:hypothetical protein
MTTAQAIAVGEWPSWRGCAERQLTRPTTQARKVNGCFHCAAARYAGALKAQTVDRRSAASYGARGVQALYGLDRLLDMWIPRRR